MALSYESPTVPVDGRGGRAAPGFPGRVPVRRCHGGLLRFGDVGLAQECGSLTEQLSECVSAAFCENAINDLVWQRAPRRIKQPVALQVLIVRISKTRQWQG